MKKKIISIIVLSLIFLILVMEFNYAIKEDNNSSNGVNSISNHLIFLGGGGNVINSYHEPIKNISSWKDNEYDKKLKISYSGIKYNPKIESSLKNNSALKVIIILKDNSGVVFVGSKEDRKNLLKQKNNWFKPKIEEILANLSSEDFKLTSQTSIGFNGEISNQGFEKLKNNSLIERIDLDHDAQADLSDSVPLINANQIWNLGYTGSGENVCIIDSGINKSHFALVGKVAGEVCYCSNGEGANSSCCRNGQSTQTGNNSALDNYFHGTAVAGIVASQNSTYRGVAYGAALYSAKVLNSTGNGVMSDIGSAIDWCVNAGVDVISISISEGGSYNSSNCPTYLNYYLDEAYNTNIPVVIATGNNHYTSGISYPACYPNAISVGSSKKDDTLDTETNRITGQDKPNVLAPGFAITTAYITGRWASATGTSFATPHVAGAVALLLDKNSSLTPDEIRDVLRRTGENISGYPRINVLAAIDSMNQTPAINCTMSNCTELGYEQCGDWTYGDCRAKIAINYYTGSNNIRWGIINDSSDPYVISNYSVGWNGVIAKKVYYDVDNPGGGDCDENGCNGEELSKIGTRITVNAPGVANTKLFLSLNSTSNYWCNVWFNGFNPNYGSNNDIYVLKCYNNGDCSSEYFCNKTGEWNTWDCVSKYAEGHSCSYASQCQSGYCDNDGLGLGDDGWCFNPYDTYFDGQESSYCEYSTGNGESDCDERQIGDSLNKCVGLTYYEDSCNSTCNYQDNTTSFSCNDIGCSCEELLCDGLSSGANITVCSSDKPYFADFCASNASGRDREDNICRSSDFASSCTASLRCNGVIAGTNNCSETFTAGEPPSAPSGLLCNGQFCTNNYTFHNSVGINCSGSTDPENDSITYGLDAYYNHTGKVEFFTDQFNNSLKSENLYFYGTQNITKYLVLNRYSNVTFASINLTGYSYSYYQENANETLATNNYLYVNYTKPNYNSRLGNLWTVKHGVGYNSDSTWGKYNITIPDSCYNYLTDKVQFRIFSEMLREGGIYTTRTSYPECFNGLWAEVGNFKSVNGSISCSYYAPDNTSLMYDGIWGYIGGGLYSTSAFINYSGSAPGWSRPYCGTGDTGHEATIWEEAVNWQVYPSNAQLRIMGSPYWNQSEVFNYSERIDNLAGQINSALNNGACDCIGCIINDNNCSIPFVFGSGSLGKIRYDDLDVTYILKDVYAWSNIGNHSSSNIFIWNIQNITNQSGVGLRCSATDLQGSQLFSDYYSPSMNLSIVKSNYNLSINIQTLKESYGQNELVNITDPPEEDINITNETLFNDTFISNNSGFGNISDIENNLTENEIEIVNSSEPQEIISQTSEENLTESVENFSSPLTPSNLILELESEYEIANYEDLYLAAANIEYCEYKPDSINDGFKICRPIVIINNKKNVGFGINTNKNNFGLDITKNIRDNKLGVSYSTDYEFYNETFLNNSCVAKCLIREEEVNDCEQNCSYESTRIKWNNWKEANGNLENILPNKLLAVRFEFEIPQYEEAHYNFTYKLLNFLLDPDVSECGTLSTADSIYTLNQNISTIDSCMIISANNITLNLNGNLIEGLINSIPGSCQGDYYCEGYYTEEECTPDPQCYWSSPYDLEPSIGVQVNADSAKIINGTIKWFDHNLEAVGRKDTLISGMSFYGNTSYSDLGVYLGSCNNSLIENSIAVNQGHTGIYWTGSNYTRLRNVSVRNSANQGGSGFYGVYSNYSNLTDLSVTGSGNQGLTLSDCYGSNVNNVEANYSNASSVAHGFNIYSSSNTNFNNLRCYGNYGCIRNYGRSSNNTYNNLSILNSVIGISLQEASYPQSNITFTNFIIDGTTNWGVYSDGNSLVNNVQNVTFNDGIIVNSSNFSVYLQRNSHNISFINVSYSNEAVDNANNSLLRYWYLDVQANYSNGTSASSANITGIDNEEVFIFSELTDSYGKILTKELIEYININGTRNYKSPYTITSAKQDYATVPYNLNLSENSFLQTFILPQSKIVNNGDTNVSVYLIMKVQYYNNSIWQDNAIIYSNGNILSIVVNQTIKLDQYWNPWNTSTNSVGTYRVYASLVDENNITLINKDGSDILAIHNFTII